MDNELGKYIAGAREKKGISQRDLAKNIKVSNSILKHNGQKINKKGR